MDFIDSTTKKSLEIFNKFIGKYILPLGFLTNPVYQRWAIALGLCLILSIILAPEIHLFTPKYKAGMIIPKDIKADRDFLVEDQESTRQKKIDAGKNIKPVYDYDSNVATNIKAKLVTTFNSAYESGQKLPKEKLAEYSLLNIQE